MRPVPFIFDEIDAYLSSDETPRGLHAAFRPRRLVDGPRNTTAADARFAVSL